ncbi:MAG: L-serine ammonia-lyase, iron-sulfur-dependent, subunit alpha [Chloroflexota bacterium]|nr:L-serine ammonia-lyase, iron-sulfur-dependent, subunit alpha [Chloroflexota bacterium]
MDSVCLVDTLRGEISQTMGCTDPVAIALATARAREELGQRPARVEITVSPNIYKNATAVGVPGAELRGIPIAAALGAVVGQSARKLALLDGVTAEMRVAAETLVANQAVTVAVEDSPPDVLYIQARVSSAEASAYAVIAGDYDNFIEVGRDDAATYSMPLAAGKESAVRWADVTYAEVWAAIEETAPAEFGFLVAAGQINQLAAEQALKDPTLKLGNALASASAPLPAPFNMIQRAQSLVAAATEARMSGARVPIMAVAGSGNQGINSLLGVLAVAEVLASTEESLAQALALSVATTSLIKHHAARMTAFCGGAVAASAGVAAGAVLLLGGGYPDVVNAVQSVLAALAGMICDGAKESCAYKINVGVGCAVQQAYLAYQGVYIQGPMGLVGKSIDETFINLGRLNNEGLAAADHLMLEIVQAC